MISPSQDNGFPGRSVAYSAAVGNTATWTAGPSRVIVWCSTNAWVKVGEGAVATTADTPIPANTPIEFEVPKGTGMAWRVSAVQDSTSGTLYAKPSATPAS